MRLIVILATTAAVRGSGALGGVLLSLIVAHTCGADGLGRLAVFMSLLGVLALLACRGKNMLLLRAVAWAEENAVPCTSVAFLRLGIMQTVLPSILLGVVGALLLVSGLMGTALPGAVAVMPVALPLLTGLALVAGYAKGRSLPWLAPVFETGGVSMLAAFILAALVFLTPALDVEVLAGVILSALFVIVLVALVVIWHDLPMGMKLPPLNEGQKAELHTGQVDFTLIAVSTFLSQAGAFVLVAPFMTEADLGLLRAAERLALIVVFPGLVIVPLISPRVVVLSRNGDAAGLRRLMLQAMLSGAGFSACLLLPLLIWPEHALSLMGPEFATAAPYLRIMASAQFLATTFGPVIVLLNMSGRERLSMQISVCTLICAGVMFPAFASLYGPAGFAMSYCVLILIRIVASCCVGVQKIAVTHVHCCRIEE